MLRHPVIVTTLEEDFKAIGLVPSKGTKSEGDEPEEQDPPAAAEDDLPGDVPGDKQNSTESRRRAGMRVENDDADADDMPPPSDEDDEPAPDDMPKAAQEWIRKRAQKIIGESRQPSRSAARSGRAPARSTAAPRRTNSSRVESLLEDVSRLVGGLKRQRKQEAVKAFANMALNAHYLGKAFTQFGRKLNEGSLLRAARVMNKLAEDAAQVATDIDQDKMTKLDPNDLDIPNADVAAPEAGGKDDKGVAMPVPSANMSAESVNALFRAQMKKLTDGLDLYADITGEELPKSDEDDELPPPSDEDDEIDPPPPPASESDDADADDMPPSEEDDEDPPAPPPAVGESRRRPGRAPAMSEQARRQVKKLTR
jgi:hypothetical protein